MKIRQSICALLPAMALGSFAMADAASDKQINQQVAQIFQQHPDLGTEIKANTKKGVVYLTGSVPTSLQKTNAEELAKGVSGVTKVIDNAGIEKGGG